MQKVINKNKLIQFLKRNKSWSPSRFNFKSTITQDFCQRLVTCDLLETFLFCDFKMFLLKSIFLIQTCLNTTCSMGIHSKLFELSNASLEQVKVLKHQITLKIIKRLKKRYVKKLDYFWHRTVIAKLLFEQKYSVNRLAK